MMGKLNLLTRGTESSPSSSKKKSSLDGLQVHWGGSGSASPNPISIPSPLSPPIKTLSKSRSRAKSSPLQSSSPTYYVKLPANINELSENVQNLSSKLVTHDKTADKIVHDMKDLSVELEVMSEYYKAIEELNDLASGGKSRKTVVTEIMEGDKERDGLQKENEELRSYIKEQQDAIDKVMTAYREQVAKLEACRDMEHQTVLVMQHELKEAERQEKEEQANLKRIVVQAVEADDKSVGKFEDIVAKLQAENLEMRKILGQVPFEWDENEMEPKPIQGHEQQDGGGD